MRRMRNLALTRVCNRWKENGSGFGRRLPTDKESDNDDDSNSDDDENEEDEEGFRDYSDPANFITGHETYLYYYWQVMEKEGLLPTCIQQLNEKVSSADGGSSVPAIVLTKKGGGLRSSMRSQDLSVVGLQQSIETAAERTAASLLSMAKQFEQDCEFQRVELLKRQIEMEKNREFQRVESLRRKIGIEKDREFQRVELLRRKIDSLEKDQIEAETKAAEIRYGKRPNDNLANFYMSKATKLKERSDECREELKQLEGKSGAERTQSA